ncbi:MAG: IS66 family transposase [Oscillospiraceae bacterium]|nr:IS66 family transposase [Oscillospiraceae bacterium]
MTKLSEEQLNSLTKAELVNMLMRLQDSVSILEERIAVMNVNSFGCKTEKLSAINPDQISIFNEIEAVADGTEYADEEPAIEPETEEITYTRKKAQGKRGTDLSALTKVEIMHELSVEELIAAFGENGWRRLPDQVYSKMEVEPAKYWVAEHHIAVYAGKNKDKIMKAKHPAELLNNSIASASVVAAILNGKYSNAMPLYRIEKEMAANGAPVSRQDMANWVIRCSERYLVLLYDRLQELLQQEHVIQADETPCYVSKDGKSAGSKSEMWVYRTGEYNTEKPIILYDYESGRAAANAIKFLGSFKGYLECDAYGGYRSIDRNNENISVCCCWAHARRRFSDAVKAYGKTTPGVQDTLAYRALEKIAAIYNADEKFKKLSPDERKKRRQTTVKRRVDAFFAWAKEHQCDTGKQDKTWAGFSYCINNEKHLRMFLEDGEIPIDNSATERAIRPFTVFRKTWKLIDTPSGADASAVMYSIVQTAKANSLNVYKYFKLLLEEIPKHMDDTKLRFIDELLPWSPAVRDICSK